MKTKYLRIGNLLMLFKDTPCKVIGFANGLLYIQYNDTKYFTIELEYASPIPLTEEWHNKFGVEINGFKEFIYEISERQRIIFTNDYIFLLDIERMDGKRSFEDNICTLWNKDIERRDIYVHEFQNLYFALTRFKKELTIK